MERIQADVCIVGSGIAGSLCAKYLAPKAGSIVVIERGAWMTHAERLEKRKHEVPIASAQHGHVVLGDVPGKRIQYVYAVGGTTNHWIGQTPRLLPEDFRMKSLYGIMEDWPVSYEELEPYYCLAEEELSVAGGSDNFRIPRSQPFPQKAHALSPGDELFKRCFPPGAIVTSPQARPTQPVGNRPECCGTATCGLCPVDSKYTALNTHIPQLERLPNVRILPQKVVVSLESDGNRKVKRAFVLGNRGEETLIEAERFVLAAHAVENAAIILRSPHLKQHLLTGKYLFDHPNVTVALVISENGYPGYGQSLFTAHCYHWYDGEHRRTRSAALGEIYNPGHLPVSWFVRRAAVEEDLHGESLQRRVSENYRRQLTINFLLEDLPNPHRLLRIGQKKGKLGIPQTEIFYTKHSKYVEDARLHLIKGIQEMMAPVGVREIVATGIEDNAGHLLGTCRMGSYQTGVVDANLRYHETDNLFILGSSAFPTYSPTNPTLTIAALAIRLGNFLS